MDRVLEGMIVRHRLCLPNVGGASGDGAVAARQFDVALMSVGFKLSGELLGRLSGAAEAEVVGVASRALGTVREMVGDHVRHNAYFIEFPANVPDTLEFWTQCIVKALTDEGSRTEVLAQLRSGVVNLLSLPTYGRYQHTYAELLEAQPEFIAATGDRLTVLHAGGEPEDEVSALYLSLAGSTTPLGEAALLDLEILAEHCVRGPQPEAIPIRENRAVINKARLGAGSELLLDTVTDVLRLACALSGGDVTLLEPTRFGTVPRRVRRALLAGLDGIVAASPAKLADVHRNREEWKRLGERLHPHEYPNRPGAAKVFAVARGELAAQSFESQVEELLDQAQGGVPAAVELLKSAPGKLFRALDRLLRIADTPAERELVLAAAEQLAPEVAGRLLLSVRQHLANRTDPADRGRVFVNRLHRAWFTPDARPRLPARDRGRLIEVLDAELLRRLPAPGRLLIDPDILDVALPISGKDTASGFGVLPRGSVTPVDGDLLRFFVYWKESSRTTDFDLSALLLGAAYTGDTWLSYTSLSTVEGEHSGDITAAPDGASEFINLRLGAVHSAFIVPQVNIYDGEGFDEVEESFFGFMLRDAEQQGRPFEPRTVRMKSDLRGPGRVALPLAFRRDGNGGWEAKWLHLFIRGSVWGNRVEGNRSTAAQLLRGIVEHTYLTVRYLVDLLIRGGASATVWDGTTIPEAPVTFIGLERPEGLHPDSRVLTPENLRDVVPD